MTNAGRSKADRESGRAPNPTIYAPNEPAANKLSMSEMRRRTRVISPAPVSKVRSTGGRKRTLGGRRPR